MTEKQPIWKDNILWVWSEYYGRYVANYSPSHYLELGNDNLKKNVKNVKKEYYK